MTSKRHHFHPRLNLQRFADSDGRVLAVETRVPHAARRQQPREIGFENYLYAPTAQSGLAPDAIEDWLATEIDSPAAAAIERLLAGDPLDLLARTAIARYLIAQDVRTPRARDVILEMFQNGLDREYASWSESPDLLGEQIRERTGRIIARDEMLSLLASYRIEVTVDAWLDFLQSQIERAHHQLLIRAWSVIEAPAGEQFVTNEGGVIKCIGPSMTPTSWALGFIGGRDTWIIPFSPDVALHISPATIAVRGVVKAPWLYGLQERAWHDAVRYVVARDVPTALMRRIGALDG